MQGLQSRLSGRIARPLIKAQDDVEPRDLVKEGAMRAPNIRRRIAALNIGLEGERMRLSRVCHGAVAGSDAGERRAISYRHRRTGTTRSCPAGRVGAAA